MGFLTYENTPPFFIRQSTTFDNNSSLEAIALIVSLLSLAIVIYKEFVQGAKLHSSINQVVSVRLPSENKNSLIQDMILDDLTSDVPSPQARAVIEMNHTFQEAVRTKNREKLLGELIEISKHQRINYDPPDHLVKKFWGDKRYSLSFFLPLVVFNSGRKFAHISSLVLVAHLKDQPNKTWAFTAFVEIDSTKFLQREKANKDLERISNLFSGFAVAPGESIQISPWFISMPDADNRIISRESMKPGSYMLQVFGYDSKDKRILVTEPVEHNVSENHLLEAFSGTESANYINIERHVADATKK